MKRRGACVFNLSRQSLLVTIITIWIVYRSSKVINEYMQETLAASAFTAFTRHPRNNYAHSQNKTNRLINVNKEQRRRVRSNQTSILEDYLDEIIIRDTVNAFATAVGYIVPRRVSTINIASKIPATVVKVSRSSASRNNSCAFVSKGGNYARFHFSLAARHGIRKRSRILRFSDRRAGASMIDKNRLRTRVDT